MGVAGSGSPRAGQPFFGPITRSVATFARRARVLLLTMAIEAFRNDDLRLSIRLVARSGRATAIMGWATSCVSAVATWATRARGLSWAESLAAASSGLASCGPTGVRRPTSASWRRAETLSRLLWTSTAVWAARPSQSARGADHCSSWLTGRGPWAGWQSARGS